jgi:hypothetical protein
VKLHATCTTFEALPPPIWQALKKMIQNAGREWGVDIEVVDGPTVPEAHQRFWQLHRIQENARLAQVDDAG